MIFQANIHWKECTWFFLTMPVVWTCASQSHHDPDDFQPPRQKSSIRWSRGGFFFVTPGKPIGCKAIWVFPKIVVSPNHPIFTGFSIIKYYKPSILGVFPLFLVQHPFVFRAINNSILFSWVLLGPPEIQRFQSLLGSGGCSFWGMQLERSPNVVIHMIHNMIHMCLFHK